MSSHTETVSPSMSQTARSARDGRRVSVLIADDHGIFRGALRQLVESTPDLVVVGEAEDGRAAEQLAIQRRPDLILMDISMPRADGVQATRNIKAALPTVKIIILSMFDEAGHVARALRAGADAYLAKSARGDEIIDTIRAVARGRAPEDALASARQETPPLTEREFMLLRLVARGLNNREIAETMNVAESTVKNRLSTLFDKLGVTDRVQAAIYALSRGLVSMDD